MLVVVAKKQSKKEIQQTTYYKPLSGNSAKEQYTAGHNAIFLVPATTHTKKLKDTATAVALHSHKNSVAYKQKNKIIGYTKPVFANKTSISYQNRPPPSFLTTQT